MTPVKSSNIEAAAYDPKTKTLTVKFKNGGTYHYSGCTQDHHDALCSAESPGKYLHAHIRGRYAHSKADGKSA